MDAEDRLRKTKWGIALARAEDEITPEQEEEAYAAALNQYAHATEEAEAAS